MKKLLSLLIICNSLISYSQEKQNLEFEKIRGNGKPLNQLANSSLMDNYDVVYYGLNIEATNLSASITSGIVTIKAKVTCSPSLSEFVIQLSSVLIVSQVKLNGEEVLFTHQENLISFTCPNTIPLGDYFSVEVHYSGTPEGGGWQNTYDSGWRKWVTWTLSESFHAYEWFPVKQSLTDKADSADIFVTVPANLTVVSNGLLKGVVDVDGIKKRFEWQSRYPIDYYLISVTISDYQEYDTYATITGLDEPLLIQNFVYNTTGCLSQYKPVIDQTAAMIGLFSNLFGVYPFSAEKYGHVMAPIGGGMEHQTMTTVSTFINFLVAHELAHMWFGDYVTCETWQDIWINEGFASYGEYLNLQYLSSQANADAWMTSNHSSSKVTWGSVYLTVAESTDEARIFSSQLSYDKGASIIHMLRNEINNDELFFAILKEFLQRNGYSTATGEDVKLVVNELTGGDYGWFFDQWYYGYGYPTYSFQFGFADSKPWVTISQTTSSSLTSLFKVSMELEFTFDDNSTSTQRVFISENPQTFTFDLPKIKSIKVDPNGWLLCSIGSILSIESIDGSDTWVSIGPNPFTDLIQFNIPNNFQLAKISITDITGKEMLKSEANQPQFEIDVTNLPKGIYVVKVISGEKISTRKLVKE